MTNRLCAVATACVLAFSGGAFAAPVVGQGTWETTLLGRDIGGSAVDGSSASAVFLYDTTLNITWLRDANAIGASGNWTASNTWANTLVVGAYGGWRLPTTMDTGAFGCDFSYGGGTDCGFGVQTKSGNPAMYEAGQTVYSEMAQMWFAALGNKAYCAPGDTTCADAQLGWGLTNTGAFQNLQPGGYWSKSEIFVSEPSAWYFYANSGYQDISPKPDVLFAFAVRDGDVCSSFPGGGATGGCFPGPGPFPAPEPTTLALLCAALLGAKVARRSVMTSC